jgi:hypothetical protein
MLSMDMNYSKLKCFPSLRHIFIDNATNRMSDASDSLRTDVLCDMHHNFDSLRLLFLYPDTARSLRLAFTHRTLTLRRSLAHRSRAVARLTYAARSSLLAPLPRLSRAPPAPRYLLWSCAAPPTPSRSMCRPPD